MDRRLAGGARPTQRRGGRRHERAPPLRPSGRLSLLLSYLIVALILATPVAVALAGADLIALSFPALLGTGLGLLLIGLGWLLFPRRARMPKQTYGRQELPHLFGLLDRVTAATQTPGPDRVWFVGDYNAFAATIYPFFGRRRRLLGIGLTLWETLDTQSRVAVLAHEIGHFASGDPERGSFLHHGKETLARWGTWLQPDAIRNPFSRRHIADLLVSTALGAVVYLLHGLWTALHWTTMFHAQVAEYLADAQSARVAGRTAVVALMDSLIMAPEEERAYLGLKLAGKPEDGWIIDHVAAEIRQVPPERAETHRRAAETQRATRRDSHPPTSARQTFMLGLPETAPAVVLDATEAAAIAAEIAPHKDRVGGQMIRALKARR